jgi:hypothetical protein
LPGQAALHYYEYWSAHLSSVIYLITCAKALAVPVPWGEEHPVPVPWSGVDRSRTATSGSCALRTIRATPHNDRIAVGTNKQAADDVMTRKGLERSSQQEGRQNTKIVVFF